MEKKKSLIPVKRPVLPVGRIGDIEKAYRLQLAWDYVNKNKAKRLAIGEDNLK